MRTYLVVFVVAAFASLLLTRWVRDYASKHGWVDLPDSKRKLHANPIPRMGGVAIFLSILVSLGLILPLDTDPAQAIREGFTSVLVMMGLAGLVLLIGLLDDFRSLKVWQKFSLQIGVALLCWGMGYRFLSAWSIKWDLFPWGWLSLPLTVLWFVGITNAFNLLDGIDGLAAGAALFATVALLVVSVGSVHPIPVLMMCALAGATLGFLRYNFNPASIFLGDSGSLLLGFMLALASLLAFQKSTAAFSIAVPLVAFGLPILDTTVVVLRRFLNRKPIFAGDRRHIHHVLIDKGFTVRKAVILLYGVCGFFGLISLLFFTPGGRNTGFALAILGICVWVAIQQLHYPELRELNAHFGRGILNQRKLIAGSLVVAKLKEGLRAARNLTALLDSLSQGLEEMEFSRAELRLPHLGGCLSASHSQHWVVISDGPYHNFYRWMSKKPQEVPFAAGYFSGENSIRISSEFKVEFGFEFTGGDANSIVEGQPTDREQRSRAKGRITFYHDTSAEYPVSAISLLSQSTWKEFADALNRSIERSGQKTNTITKVSA